MANRNKNPPFGEGVLLLTKEQAVKPALFLSLEKRTK